MAFLLTQGLMANDASKIDTVLEKTNPSVIHVSYEFRHLFQNMYNFIDAFSK